MPKFEKEEDRSVKLLFEKLFKILFEILFENRFEIRFRNLTRDDVQDQQTNFNSLVVRDARPYRLRLRCLRAGQRTGPSSQDAQRRGSRLDLPDLH